MSKFKTSWATGTAIVLILFLAGILMLVSIALHEDVSLVQEKYYERGQEYDLHRRAMERAQSLADPLGIHVTPGELSVRFPRNSTPGELKGTILLYRPSDRSLDRAIVIAPDSGWLQAIPLRGLQPGFWRIKIEWKMNGEDYYSEQSVVF
jgi:hypothetical protein